jgi:hypothetical protein
LMLVQSSAGRLRSRRAARCQNRGHCVPAVHTGQGADRRSRRVVGRDDERTGGSIPSRRARAVMAAD